MDESWKGGIDVVLIGAGILAAIGGTSPLWWQELLTKYCLGQKGFTEFACNSGVFSPEACQQCASYGVSVWIPFLVGLVSLLALLGKLKDALNF